MTSRLSCCQTLLIVSLAVGLCVAAGHAADGVDTRLAPCATHPDSSGNGSAPGCRAAAPPPPGRATSDVSTSAIAAARAGGHARQAVAAPPRPASSATAEVTAKVDAVFKDFTRPATPGCAVGVAVDGKPALARAYGMADLEHDIENRPDTIFEAGSVSKQFTAAAVLLLAREGKLSLDDPARTYIPELPDYGAPLTIRHMLTHTSGLRDWGSVEGIIGWPRGTRANTHAHVLDIVSRQRALNFPSGTRYSYSNTGYNLAAIIVARVSGLPFAEFTRLRLFEPLGMTHTSWRDDYTRVVKGRSVAYSKEKDGFHMDMPFENVHGNGGLLTTVGDLLIWNENFVSPRVGDAAFVALQQEPGRFNDGRPHGYAFGLQVGSYKGLREVSHSGATGGYRTDLLRYPDQHLSVAVLCNAATANAVAYAHDVADLYLADRVKTSNSAATHKLTAAEAEAVEGLYRHTATGRTLRIVRDEQKGGGVALRLDAGAALTATSATSFTIGAANSLTIDAAGRATLTDAARTVDVYERVPPAKPDAASLQALAGTYVSADAEATFTVKVDGATLIVERRPDTRLPLTPLYADAFTSPDLGLVIFRRDASGRPAALSVVQDRVWDLRFARQP